MHYYSSECKLQCEVHAWCKLCSISVSYVCTHYSPFIIVQSVSYSVKFTRGVNNAIFLLVTCVLIIAQLVTCVLIIAQLVTCVLIIAHLFLSHRILSFLKIIFKIQFLIQH